MIKSHPIAAGSLILLAASLFAAFPLGTANAEMLEKEECNALKSQQKTLLTATVQAALRRGPDWVKDHLHDPEKIEQIRQYLEVEEKVAFRCRTDGVRIPKPEPPSLPDRKPPVPTFIVAGVEANSLMPIRNPSRDEASEIAAMAAQERDAQGEGDTDRPEALASDDAAKDEAVADDDGPSEEIGLAASEDTAEQTDSAESPSTTEDAVAATEPEEREEGDMAKDADSPDATPDVESESAEIATDEGQQPSADAPKTLETKPIDETGAPTEAQTENKTIAADEAAIRQGLAKP